MAIGCKCHKRCGRITALVECCIEHKESHDILEMCAQVRVLFHERAKLGRRNRKRIIDTLAAQQLNYELLP